MQAEEARRLIDRGLESLGEALEAGRSDALRTFLSTMAIFHRYSLGNTLLIMIQSPEATHVAGFRTWLKLGRSVRKGEKGIAILAPIGPRKAEGSEESKEPPKDEEERPVRFRVAYVFDVAQTEGEPLPAFARPEGEPGEFLPRLRDLVADMEIALEYRESMGGAQGSSSGGLIAIKRGLTPAEEFSTLVHELAHERLHKGEARVGTSLRSRELEAEAVAFVVSQGIGVEARDASSDYIQLYGGGKEGLVRSLDAIREVSRLILAGLFEEPKEEEEDTPPPSLPSVAPVPLPAPPYPAQPSLFG